MIGFFSLMYSFNIPCHSCIHSIKFAKAINILLICHELFYIFPLMEMLNHSTWRSRDELIRDVLLWIPTHGRAKAGRPAQTYIQQLCEDTGCCPEDLPRAMNDREEWRERARDIRAASTIWWWWWQMSKLCSSQLCSNCGWEFWYSYPTNIWRWTLKSSIPKSHKCLTCIFSSFIKHISKVVSKVGDCSRGHSRRCRGRCYSFPCIASLYP